MSAYWMAVRDDAAASTVDSVQLCQEKSIHVVEKWNCVLL